MTLYCDGERDMTSNILHIVEDDTRSLSERLETATSGVLNSIQDAISELEHVPWPSTDGREMAMPGARLLKERLVLWYGDEANPLVSLQPIAVRELWEE